MSEAAWKEVSVVVAAPRLQQPPHHRRMPATA